MTTTGIYHKAGDLTLHDATISNRDAAPKSNNAHAALCFEGGGHFDIRNTNAKDSQRAGLFHADHDDGRWMTGTIDRMRADGFRHVHHQSRTRKLNETLLFHGRPRDEFPDQTGIGDVTITNFSAVNRPASVLGVWEIRVRRLYVDGLTDPDNVFVLAVNWPVEQLTIASADIKGVSLRLRPGCTADMLGDIVLDDRYEFALHDQRDGRPWGMHTSYVGNFERIGLVRDWMSKQ